VLWHTCFECLWVDMCVVCLYSYINYHYIMGDQRMMSFGFSGSPPPFSWQIKYDDDDDSSAFTEHIQYKIAVLSYKVLHDTAPRYLGPLTHVADIPGRRALRSASTDRLEVPYFKLSTIGSRAFPVATFRSGTHYQTQSFRHQHFGRSSTN